MQIEPLTHGLASVLDALPTEVAVIDREGTIVYVNKSWIKFSADQMPSGHYDSPVGQNYLRVCDADPDATEYGVGIRSVLTRQVIKYETRYTCHGPDEYRLFLLQVTPISDPIEGAIISHIRLPIELINETEIMVGLPSTMSSPITNSFVGVKPLAEAAPGTFEELCEEYAKLLDEAVETTLIRKSRRNPHSVRLIGKKLAQLRGTARDALGIHLRSFSLKMRERPSRGAGYIEESRYLLIELLGSMVSHYRMQSFGFPSKSTAISDPHDHHPEGSIQS